MSNYQIGVWQTNNVVAGPGPGIVAGKKNSKTIIYASEEPESPHVSVGLKMISASKDTSRVGARTYASSIDDDKFTLNVDSLPHTKLLNGAAMWFKFPNIDSDLQQGVVKVKNTALTTVNVTKLITFEKAYTTQPKVFVGISGFDIGIDWNIHVYATDIDVNGFRLHVDTWGIAEVHSAEVNWVAFSAHREDITTGTFSSLDNGNFNGQVNITPALSGSPQLFYAISMFDSDKAQNIEIKVDVSNVSSSRFSWKVTTTAPAKNTNVSGSYLAVVM